MKLSGWFEHSLPPSGEIKNAWNCTSNPSTRIHGVVLNEAQDASLWCGT